MGAANIFTGRVLARKEHIVHLETPSGLRLVCQCAAAVSVGASLSVVVRPDVVQVVPHRWTWTGDNAFHGRVTTKTYLGEVTALTVALRGVTQCCVTCRAVLNSSSATRNPRRCSSDGRHKMRMYCRSERRATCSGNDSTLSAACKDALPKGRGKSISCGLK